MEFLGKSLKALHEPLLANFTWWEDNDKHNFLLNFSFKLSGKVDILHIKGYLQHTSRAAIRQTLNSIVRRSKLKNLQNKHAYIRVFHLLQQVSHIVSFLCKGWYAYYSHFSWISAASSSRRGTTKPTPGMKSDILTHWPRLCKHMILLPRAKQKWTHDPYLTVLQHRSYS